MVMPQECPDAWLDPVRAADLLKLGGNLAVAELGIVAAIAADQLIFHGAVMFLAAVSVAGWLPPQSERPFLLRPVIHRHVCRSARRRPVSFQPVFIGLNG